MGAVTEIEPIHVKDDWLDASKIATLHLCPEKYKWRYERHLVPIDRQLLGAAEFGTAIHASLATLFDGTSGELVTCPCLDIAGCNFCEGNLIPNYFARFLIWYPWDPDFESDSKNPRTRAHGLHLLRAYLEKYRQQGFEIIPGSVERTIAIDMGEFTYLLRLDMACRTREIDECFPADHKTSSFFSDLYLQPYQLSIQLHGQAVGSELILEKPIGQVMVDLIRTSKNVDADESFKRLYVTVTPESKERWKMEVEVAHDLITRYRGINFWPRHAPYSCSAYNRRCDYFSLCTSGKEQQEILIENAFEVVVWNPLNLSD